jgi:hypothetical protein
MSSRLADGPSASSLADEAYQPGGQARTVSASLAVSGGGGLDGPRLGRAIDSCFRSFRILYPHFIFLYPCFLFIFAGIRILYPPARDLAGVDAPGLVAGVEPMNADRCEACEGAPM